MVSLSTTPFLAVPADASSDEALDALAAAGAEFCLVGNAAAPLTLLSREDLRHVSGTPGNRLRDQLGQLPAAVFIQNATGFSADDVRTLALLLEDTLAPGLIVLGEQAVDSVVAAAAVAKALIDITPAKTSAKLRGVPDVTGPTFVCQKHQPPLYLYPRTGDQVPRCPSDPLHGRMERADL